MKPATTKVASCYSPSGSIRMIEIRRDNTKNVANRAHGRFVIAVIRNGVGESSMRATSESDAIGAASDLGYTDVVLA